MSVIDWTLFIAKTDGGIMLVPLTLDRAMADFEEWAQYERTGIKMAQVGAKPGNIPWSAILTRFFPTGWTPETIDQEKLFSKMGADLKLFKAADHSKGKTATVPELSDKDAIAHTTKLHKIFKEFGADSGINLDQLATVFWMQNRETAATVEKAKTTIKALARHSPKTFSIGLGPSPEVRRLQTEKGAKTLATAFPVAEKKSRKDGGPRPKGLLRFANQIKNLMELLDVEPTKANFDNWEAYCVSEKITDPKTEDFKAFVRAQAGDE